MHSYENEPIVVQREVKAVAIPAGVEVNLKLGSVGYITQALGGSFTVYIDGNLFRIAGQDADAIGKTASAAPEVPPGASEEDIKNIIWQQLKTCFDPEIPVNIVDLGLVYECDVSKNDDATRTVVFGADAGAEFVSVIVSPSSVRTDVDRRSAAVGLIAFVSS